MTGNSTAPLPSPMANQMPGPAQTSYGQQFSPSRPAASPSSASTSHLQHSLPYGSHAPASHAVMPQTPVYQNQQPYSQHTASATTPVAQHHHASIPYNQYHSTAGVPRAMPQSSTSHATHANVYNPPRQSEIYTLSETANSAIPADVRNQFHRDDYGKVLFFTAPPLNIDPVPEKAQVLGHSLRYLADKARNKEADEKKRKARAARLEEEASERAKRMKIERESMTQFMLDQKAKVFKKLSEDMDRGTDDLYKRLHGENWEEMRKEDTAKLIARQEAASKEQDQLEDFKDELKKREEARNIGSKLT
jgi:chromatin structure-remodeling complex subunit RSC1/2